MSDPYSIVVSYDPAWPAMFESLRQAIVPTLVALDATIEHVGSTSVPGLAAKPIIDLDIVVASAGLVPEAINRLGQLGYVHEGDLGVPGREAMKKPPELRGIPHHLYVVVAGNQAHRDHVDLRNYLRAHPTEAERYAAAKQQVAHLLVADRPRYFAAKDPLIQELLERARGSCRE